jgi:parallel beta-helix repeat protein
MEVIIMHKKPITLFLLGSLMFGLLYLNVNIGQASNPPANYPFYLDSDYFIDADFAIAGNIYLNGHNLEIRDCIINVTGYYTINVYGTENLTLTNVTVVGLSSGSTLFIFHNGDRLNIVNSKFINLSGTLFRLNGYATISNNQFEKCVLPIEAYYTHNSIFANNKFTDCDTGIEFISGVYSENITIYNNTFSNGYYAIRPNSLTFANIRNNLVQGCSIAGIYGYDVLEWSLIENNTIKNCTTGFSQNRLYNTIVRNNSILSASSEGLAGYSLDNVSISDNIISVTSGKALIINDMDLYPVISNISNNQILLLSTSTNIDPIKTFDNLVIGAYPAIIDNSTTINGIPVRTYFNINNDIIDLDGETISRFSLINCSNVIVRNSKISKGDGMEMVGCNNITVEHFDISQNFDIGLLLMDCHNSTIQNGNISNNLLNGIEAKMNNYWGNTRWVLNCTFQNLTINQNAQHGIDLNFANNLTLGNNTIMNNTQNGIRMNYAESNLLQFNKISGNKLGGIFLLNNASYNLIQNNTFLQNDGFNIRLEFESAANHIRWNDLVKSSKGEFMYNILCSVNTSTIEMNHYSDYYGFDLSPKDGFGDSSYRVNMTNDALNVVDLIPLFKDLDDDGLDDFVELFKYGTNFSNSDTDGDGLNDFAELFPTIYFATNITQFHYMFILKPTNPFINDTDEDGLTDYEELSPENGYRTDPNNKDTDYDSFSDFLEVIANTSPLNNTDWPGRSNQNQSIILHYDEQLTEVPQQRSVKEIDGYSPWILIFNGGLIIFLIIFKKVKVNKKIAGGQYHA